jgi:hypothetical protein
MEGDRAESNPETGNEVVNNEFRKSQNRNSEVHRVNHSREGQGNQVTYLQICTKWYLAGMKRPQIMSDSHIIEITIPLTGM